MSSFEQQSFDPHSVDLRSIDEGRLILPSVAEGPDIHNLKLESMTVPVSFAVLPTGHFRLNGMQEGHAGGLVMSGFLANTDAKINHVLVDGELRRYAKEHGNERVGEVALADLEQNLISQGVGTAYAVFYTPETIDFFRRNGYSVTSLDSVENERKSALGIDPVHFNTAITDDTSFDRLRPTNPEEYRHIILKKQIGGTVKQP